jgi:ABC-2 type transport system ATP-binding protein
VGDVIITAGLSRVFADQRVVDGLNLRVPAGEIFGLLGPNGAGKTTAIRMLTTLLAPSEGQAQVCGMDVVTDAAAVRRRIGYVSQDRGVRYLLTGRESVEIEADLHHVPRRHRGRRVDEVLDAVGLLPHADRFVAEYSGGMQKRLDLACGLLRVPELLVLDEPTLGLDVQSRHRIWDHVNALRDQGVTVLLATNYLDEADRLCDRLTIIDAGREVVTGAPADLKRSLGGTVIEVSSAAPDRLRGALDGLPWVRHIAAAAPDGLAPQAGGLATQPGGLATQPGGLATQSGGRSAESGGLHIFVADAAAALPELVRVSLEHDIGLTRVTCHQPTLDDVFLLHTRKEPPGGERPAGDVGRPARFAVPPLGSVGPAAGSSTQEVLALIRRWYLQFNRERLQLLFTLLQPAIWLVFFGSAVGRTVNAHIVGTADYTAFMLPGVITFTIVGTGISGAIPLLWDKETGYLNKLMSMPIARGSLLVSRLAFQTAIGAAQTFVTLVVATAMGVRLATHVPGALLVVITAALLALALTAVFMALAYYSPGHDTFFAITGFVTLPLLFMSSAFVPLDAMPAWMAIVAKLNPLTYAIESIRVLVIEGWRPQLLGYLAMLGAFAAVCLAFGASQFRTRTGGGNAA